MEPSIDLTMLGSGAAALAALLLIAAADAAAARRSAEPYAGPAPIVGGLAGIAAALAVIALLA